MTDSSQAGWTPRPDPTVLTTAQLLREIDALRALMEARIEIVENTSKLLQVQIDRRLERLDVALQQEIRGQGSLREFATEETLRAANTLRELMDERDSRSRDALSTALAATRELNALQDTANNTAQAKAEATTSKQIDQLTTLIGALDKATADRIGELKERIDRGEGGQNGRQFEISERRLTINQVIAIATVFLTVIGLVIAAVIAFHH